jgi:hypothetical protein
MIQRVNANDLVKREFSIGLPSHDLAQRPSDEICPLNSFGRGISFSCDAASEWVAGARDGLTPIVFIADELSDCYAIWGIWAKC